MARLTRFGLLIACDKAIELVKISEKLFVINNEILTFGTLSDNLESEFIASLIFCRSLSPTWFISKAFNSL